MFIKTHQLRTLSKAPALIATVIDLVCRAFGHEGLDWRTACGYATTKLEKEFRETHFGKIDEKNIEKIRAEIVGVEMQKEELSK